VQLKLLPPVIEQFGLSGLSVQVTPAGSVSVIVTLFAVTPDAALVAVMVKLPVLPALIGVALATLVMETSVLETRLNVAMICWSAPPPDWPMSKVQGEFVPVQVVDPPLEVSQKPGAKLQPAKT